MLASELSLNTDIADFIVMGYKRAYVQCGVPVMSSGRRVSS